MSQYVKNVSDFCDLLFDVQDSDRDAMVIISGDTGGGKSVLSWQISKGVCEKRNVVFNPVRALVYDREEFNRACDSFEEFSVINGDEAVGLFYARDYHDDEQIAVLKKLDRLRYRHLVLLLCIPNMFHIDKHLRDSRVRYWIYVFERKGKGEGGYARAYVFDKEANPFNPDPWNLSFNRKLFAKGKIDKSPNYVGEILFHDISVKEHEIYRKIKDAKRYKAESVEWKKAQKKKRAKGVTGEKLDKRLMA